MLEIKDIKNDIIRVTLIALECAHEPTCRHTLRTAAVAVRIAALVDPGFFVLPPIMRLNDIRDVTLLRVRRLNAIRDIACLHDVGKLYVPVQILEKKESLDEREWETMRFHPIWGERVLQGLSDERLQSFARYILEHHELPDGSGYPRKLALVDIDPVSRIINIADRFAAMTENRSYRKAVPAECAIKMLELDITAFFDKEAAKVVKALAGFGLETAPKAARDPVRQEESVEAFMPISLAAAG